MPSERQRIIEQFEGRFSARAIRRRRINHLVQSNGWLIWIQLLSGARRSLELLLAALLLATLSPLLLILFIAVKARGGRVLHTPRLGRWGCAFNEISFSSGPFAGLPALLNVLRGNMSLVGPRAVSPSEVSAADRAAWRRFNTRPGFICLWWIRRRANIAWGSESDADSEYLDTQSVWGDLAIGLRAIPAAFYGEGVTVAPERIELMGIGFNNLTMEEAVAGIVDRARNPYPSQLCFVNADCVNVACHDADYNELLANSAIVLADGIGLKLAGKILNNNIRQNVNGTDLFPQLCDALAKLNNADLGLYLLGGKPGVPEDVARWIAEHYPATRVSGFHHGFFTHAETSVLLGDIRRSGAAILLVAFGVPKQEKWIRDNLAQTGVGMAIGVGGLFDFYSGRVPRAPIWIRELGMEWLYRFAQEPSRMWRRYFVGNFIFLVRAVSERFLARAEHAQRDQARREPW
jgi:N-acetylglucosaminyldiphosphoundecaprenol N-acetyl-beta-D-mannosaminyltransferase